MLNRFSRAELIFGEDNMNKLANSRIAVFGIGGVGGYAVEALARSGVLNLDLFDDDKICITNINRQIHALSSTIGKYKVEAAHERIIDINPKANVNIYKTFVLPENMNEIDFNKYDYIIDAVDTVSAKIALILKAQEANIKIISAMGAGNKINAAAFEVCDIYKTKICPLARVMRRELKKRGVKNLKVVYSQEVPIEQSADCVINCKNNCVCPPGTVRKCTQRRAIPGSTAFVPPVVGLIIAGEVVRDLLDL